MSNANNSTVPDGPLKSLEEWDDFVKTRYPEGETELPAPATEARKELNEFRNYSETTPPCVREFYRLNHTTRRAILSWARKDSSWPRVEPRWASGMRWNF